MSCTPAYSLHSLQYTACSTGLQTRPAGGSAVYTSARPTGDTVQTERTETFRTARYGTVPVPVPVPVQSSAASQLFYFNTGLKTRAARGSVRTERTKDISLRLLSLTPVRNSVIVNNCIIIVRHTPSSSMNMRNQQMPKAATIRRSDRVQLNHSSFIILIHQQN